MKCPFCISFQCFISQHVTHSQFQYLSVPNRRMYWEKIASNFFTSFHLVGFFFLVFFFDILVLIALRFFCVAHLFFDFNDSLRFSWYFFWLSICFCLNFFCCFIFFSNSFLSNFLYMWLKAHNPFLFLFLTMHTIIDSLLFFVRVALALLSHHTYSIVVRMHLVWEMDLSIRLWCNLFTTTLFITTLSLSLQHRLSFLKCCLLVFVLYFL